MSKDSLDITTNLTRIKKKTIKTVNQDGVLDIVLGLTFLLIGITFYVEKVFNYDIPYAGVIIILPITVLLAELRKRATFRRIGFVDIHTRQHVSIAIAVIFFIVLVLLILKELTSIPLEYFKILPFIFLGGLAVCFFLYSRRYNIKRYTLYSLAPLCGLILLVLPFSSLGLRFLFSLVLIGLCMIFVGLVTLHRFKKSLPVLSENPEIRHDLSSKKKLFILFLQDGLDEIFLTITFVTWIVIYLVGKIIPIWCLAIIVFVSPIVLGLLSSQIRKAYSKRKLEQNEVTKYVVTMSAMRNGAVMLCVNIIGYEIITKAGIVDFFLPGSQLVASLIFIGFGCYYCILSLVYKLSRLMHIGIISILCLFLYTVNTTQFFRFIIYASIMALVLVVNGIISRSRFAQGISLKEVPYGR